MPSLSFDIIRERHLFSSLNGEIPLSERIAVINLADDTSTPIDEVQVFKENIFCFFLVKKGKADMEINGISKEIKRGDLACSIPGDTWMWKKRDMLQGVFILFDAAFILSVLNGNFSLEPISHLNSDYHYPFISLSKKRFIRLSNLAEEMDECLNEQPIFYDLLRTELWQFIFLSEKEYMANGKGERKTSTPNHIPLFISLVNKFFSTSHTAAFYADKMNITTNYLNKIVKNALGTSTRNYIMNRVISEAKFLLRLTDINASELAYTLGFKDPNYFIRCFKKSEGITPMEYQRKGTL